MTKGRRALERMQRFHRNRTASLASSRLAPFHDASRCPRRIAPGAVVRAFCGRSSHGAPREPPSSCQGSDRIVRCPDIRTVRLPTPEVAVRACPVLSRSLRAQATVSVVGCSSRPAPMRPCAVTCSPSSAPLTRTRVASLARNSLRPRLG